MQARRVLSTRLSLLLSVVALPSCDRGEVPEPEPTPAKRASATSTTATVSDAEKLRRLERAREAMRSASRGPASTPRKVEAKPVAAVKPAPGDPTGGNFGMEQAMKGLEGTGDEVVAKIETELGTLTCDLWPDKAPLTVANFVGLARGTRPWKSDGKWVEKPLYDGTTFHRIIKGFMIQGGDPNGNGSGGPGYEIPDEIWEDAHHDERGQICMANRGPNTNGSQFFIMDGAASHLDGGYTIFGKCGPEDLVVKLASVPTRGQTPEKPPKIKKVTIERGS